MKFNKIMSVTTLVASGIFIVPAQATSWSSKCGDSHTGCSASDYFAEDLRYMIANDGISSAVVDGVTISTTAYSDTGGQGFSSRNYDYTYSQSNGKHYLSDDIVETASLINYGEGYGIINKDVTNTPFTSDTRSGEYGVPQHAADNINLDWYASGYHIIETDYDFYLISFDEEVNVTGATFSWLWNSGDTQVSVAALNDISMLTSGANTWADIAGEALAVGSYDVLNCEDTNLAMVDMDTTYSQYWLIGAYNLVFGDIGGTLYDDAFKLASIGFSKKEMPQTDVPEPGTLALFLMGGSLALWRRKQQKSSVTQ
ncbi:PEP-CTERM sorting domain-containing protein [Alteromonas sp. 1_MG-2023]|uniref:exosortase-dependent surface protein XDP1 n=1 Tax=Alteromonas sp. 1_MG-2023 TaxID=3062669 RepID=UPI0026E38513|nr:exosortase-dependent surface protein XDP1 [Alteromonas sp. 1_MG-2023]MDO6475068.1 PEP-CTERM sorting domain-containing protein [Alteromonas sp. 1_MG-2023]